MREAAGVLASHWPEARVTRAVVYAHPRAVGSLDLYWASYDGAHFLEWNWCNAGHGVLCAYDFDGILCMDSEPGAFAVAEIPPLYLPRREAIPLIVTGRPESLRAETEDWLRRHGVSAARMVMRPETVGVSMREIGEWKAGVYRASDTLLFAESDPVQAEIIHARTGKAVLCPALGRVFPGELKKPEPRDPALWKATLRLSERVQSCIHRDPCGCGIAKCAKYGGEKTYQDCYICPDLPPSQTAS
jgi:hypothetical protein